MAYSAHDLTDTIVALATPPGRGAIAVLRLAGPRARAIAAASFRGKDLREQPSHTVHFGTVRDEEEQLIDEVLATVFIAPNSYTGEDVVEISCHGSSYIIQALIRLYVRAGARLARAGEFTLRAFLNGKLDLSQAEAVGDLIAAESAAAHDLALRQLRGGFSHDIQALRQQLIDFASLIELELDFGEEDVEFVNRGELRRLVEHIRTVIAGLLQSFSLGNAIRQGVSTVIAGRPNAGKSTLLNALLNEERAIVSDIAGTTRDTIEEVLVIRGVPFRLIDTAGIRDATETIEAIGVERTLEKVRQASLLVYVFDVIQLSPADVRSDLERLYRPGMHLLIVANKMDLNPYTTFAHYFGESTGGFSRQVNEEGAEVKGQRSADNKQEAEAHHVQASEAAAPGKPHSSLLTPHSSPPHHLTPHHLTISADQWVPIVAREGMNIEYLKEKLYAAVINEQVSLDQTVVTNARHYEALQRADEALADVLRGLETNVTSDFVALDIRRALHHLGEITGEISTEDLLGNIFGRFCIGK